MIVVFYLDLFLITGTSKMQGQIETVFKQATFVTHTNETLELWKQMKF